MGNVWADKMLELLDLKTKQYSNQENKNISRIYIENLLKRIKSESFVDDKGLFVKIENVINDLPEKVEGERLKYTSKHLNEMSDLKSVIRKNCNYVSNGYYKKVFMPLGIAIGSCFGTSIGVAFKNMGLIGLGMPFGLMFGLILGSFLDKKAEKENRVL